MFNYHLFIKQNVSTMRKLSWKANKFTACFWFTNLIRDSQSNFKKNRLDYEIDFALLIWLHIGTCLDISLNGTNQDLKRNLSRIKIKMMSSFTLMKLFLLATKYLLRKQIMFVSFSFIFVARFSVFLWFWIFRIYSNHGIFLYMIIAERVVLRNNHMAHLVLYFSKVLLRLTEKKLYTAINLSRAF